MRSYLRNSSIKAAILNLFLHIKTIYLKFGPHTKSSHNKNPAKPISLAEVRQFIFIGNCGQKQIPHYISGSKRRFFLVSGGVNSAVSAFVSCTIKARLEINTGMIFFDARNDVDYLSYMQDVLIELDRLDDLFVITDLDFDVLEALQSNKVIYIRLNDEIASSPQYKNMLYKISDFSLRSRKDLPIFSIFTNGCDEYLDEYWGLMHSACQHSRQQINIFHISYTPEKISESIIDSMHNTLFFKLDNPDLLYKTDIFDYAHDDFYKELKLLKHGCFLRITDTGLLKTYFIY